MKPVEIDKIQKQLDELISDQAMDTVKRDALIGQIEVRKMHIDMCINILAMEKTLNNLKAA